MESNELERMNELMIKTAEQLEQGVKAMNEAADILHAVVQRDMQKVHKTFEAVRQQLDAVKQAEERMRRMLGPDPD